MKLAVALLALVLLTIRAALNVFPPDNDPIYYQLVAAALARGEGFTIDVIWTWLAPPAGVHHPAFDYWMPLTSLLVAPFSALPGFGPAAPIILSGVLAVHLTHRLALRHLEDPRLAIAPPIALLAAASFSDFASSTDSVLPYVALILVLVELLPKLERHALAFGALAGLAVLLRADARVVVVAGAALFVLAHRPRPTWRALALAALALAVVVAPWAIRNALVFGTASPPASAKVPLLMTWGEAYSHGATPSFARYLEALRANPGAFAFRKGLALYYELAAALTVLGPVGAPLIALGAHALRARAELRAYACLFLAFVLSYALLADVTMNLGGAYRSQLAFAPLATVLAAGGLRFALSRAPRLVAPIAIAGALLALGHELSLWPNFAAQARARRASYAHVERLLDRHLPPGAPVMSTEPLRVRFATGRPSVLAPNDGPAALCAVARRYAVEHLLFLPGWYAENFGGPTLSDLEGAGFAALDRDGRATLHRLDCP